MADQRKWKQHRGSILDSVKGFDVVDCEACKFRHIVPVPSTEELKLIYRQEYYSKEKPLYLERNKEDLDWWDLVYGERYDNFEKFLPRERKRILDVGSGPGFFLLHGKRRGWQTFGIEPSALAVAHSRELGLEIVDDFLTKQTAKKFGKLDVVHMSEVLEHIPDPKNMLLLVRNLLVSGGLICVVVPNDYNPFQLALRTACSFKPWWVAPPHHINYFDFNSLSSLLSLCGFEIVWQEATFPIDIFLLMGDNYVGNDKAGRKLHGKRKHFEQNLKKAGLSNVKRALYQALAENNLGREAVVYGRKK